MIFNKSNNGTVEVKGILGFIYKSINFDNLSPYIELATDDIIKIIGQDTYDIADDYYNSTPEEVDDASVALVKLVQKVIAVGAYRMFVVGNDLSHTPEGRQITVTATQKPAFSWQLKKDNENLSNLYYKYIESMLLFLDSSDFVEWKSSDQYKIAHELLINTAEEFDTYFVIEKSRRLFLAVAPIMKRIERSTFKSMLNADLYSLLKSFILDPTVVLSESESEILESCKMPLVMLTMADACKLLSSQILPDRIVSMFDNTSREASSESSNNESLETRHALSGTFSRIAKDEIRKFQILVSKYYATKIGTTYTGVEMYLPGQNNTIENKDVEFPTYCQRGNILKDEERDKFVSFN